MSSRKPKERGVCKFCQKPLDATLSHLSIRKFCSRECWKNYVALDKTKQRTLICKFCQKPFDIFLSQSLTKKFCSIECRKSYYKTKVEATKKVCFICGKSFIPLASNLRTSRKNHHFYCSFACYNKKRKAATIKKTCPFCKKHFSFPEYEHRVFCSNKCYQKAKATFKKYLKNNQHNGMLSAVRKKPSSLEIFLYRVLDDFNIPYEKQYILCDITVADAYIPSLKLAVYIDGMHHFYYEDTKQRDRKQEKVLKKNGYKIIRITEAEIRELAIKEIWEAKIKDVIQKNITASQKAHDSLADPLGL